MSDKIHDADVSLPFAQTFTIDATAREVMIVASNRQLDDQRGPLGITVDGQDSQILYELGHIQVRGVPLNIKTSAYDTHIEVKIVNESGTAESGVHLIVSTD